MAQLLAMPTSAGLCADGVRRGTGMAIRHQAATSKVKPMPAAFTLAASADVYSCSTEQFSALAPAQYTSTTRNVTTTLRYTSVSGLRLSISQIGSLPRRSTARDACWHRLQRLGLPGSCCTVLISARVFRASDDTAGRSTHVLNLFQHLSLHCLAPFTSPSGSNAPSLD